MTGKEEAVSIYEMIGGAAVIRPLVEAFYPKVQNHALLGPLFPTDITPVMEKQIQFLTQFFGGPMLYSQEHGHPMMRARHMPFQITSEHAEAWLTCMKEAMNEVNIQPEIRDFLLDRLQGPAYHFVNS